MSLNTKINTPDAETLVSSGAPSDTMLWRIQVLYTYNQESYTIVKYRWLYRKYYRQNGELIPAIDRVKWVEECGVILNQLGEIEYAYKGLQEVPLDQPVATWPDNKTTCSNVRNVLPKKMRELLDMLSKFIKDCHKENVNAILSSKATKPAALHRDSWSCIITRWVDSNKAYQVAEFGNGVLGTFVSKLSSLGEIGLVVDCTKRGIKQLSDQQQNDVELFVWERNS